MREIVGKALAEFLIGVDDLDQCQRAVTREKAIRDGVAQTGETREAVVTVLDSIAAMDQEAVLDLTDGAPTTMRAGLQRYIEELRGRDDLISTERVVIELMVLLGYPWPGTLLEIHEDPDADKGILIVVDGRVVDRTDYEEGGYAGTAMAERVARSVHRAAR